MSLVGKVFCNTNLSAAAGAVTAMCISWAWKKKPDIAMTLNGALAGLVSITAGADVISTPLAVLVGIVAGAIVVGGMHFIENVVKIDDPVGAIAPKSTSCSRMACCSAVVATSAESRSLAE